MHVYSHSAFYSTDSSSLINQRQLFLACMLSKGENVRSHPKQFWHRDNVWWKALMVAFYLQICWEVCGGNDGIFLLSHRKRIRLEAHSFFSPPAPKELVSCHVLKKLLYTCLARTVSNIHPLLCSDTLMTWLTLMSVFLLLLAHRVGWCLSAARSAAAASLSTTVGSVPHRKGSAEAPGFWHIPGLDLNITDTTWIFGENATGKNRRPVR